MLMMNNLSLGPQISNDKPPSGSNTNAIDFMSRNGQKTMPMGIHTRGPTFSVNHEGLNYGSINSGQSSLMKNQRDVFTYPLMLFHN
jgi:hypothetical protein